MKKSVKILSVSLVALLLSVGAVINFLKAVQTETTVSDLTLANIEALAVDANDVEKPVAVPCCPAKAESICTFPTINCDGSRGEISVKGMESCREDLL
ncbi:MAG: hypothetical protein J1E79_08035 [Rikenella sp.]|nr:hypothetical protein [Rikenella sp.]